MRRIYVLAALFAALTAPAVAHAQTLTAPIDLLHRTGAQIGVSSEVENPTDMPDALVDGDPSKAWQSRTGDLKGAWVAFRVAPDAHIARIGIVPGVAKKTDTLDLRTANQRLTKVRLTDYESGKLVGDFALDPAKPELQYIPVDLPGGAYKLTVTGVLAGSKKAWRELAIGEVRVEGTPGSDAPGPANVYVGPLGVRAHLTELVAPFGALPSAKCPPEFSTGADHERCIEGQSRVPVDLPGGSALSRGFRESITVQVQDGSAGWVSETLVRTAKQWFALGSWTQLENAGCVGGSEVLDDERRFVGPYFVNRTRGMSWSNPIPSQESGHPSDGLTSYSFYETTRVCHASGATLACTAFTTATAPDRKLDHPIDATKVTWTPATKLSFAKDGTLLVTPPAAATPLPASK